MKRMLKGYLSLVALFSVAIFSSSANANFFQIRSQSFDSANWLVGITNQINLYDMGGFYGTFNFKYEYARNFRGERITQCLFGNALVGGGTDSLSGINNNFGCNTGCNTGCDTDCNTSCGRLLIQGSCAADRNPRALLADYFGLPTDFKSEITFCPRIEQHIFDFSFWAGLDEWLCGLWFMAHAPIVHARWDLNAHERITTAGVNPYPAGYFAPAEVPRSDLVESFCAYQGGATPTLNGGVTFDALNRCQFRCSSANNCDDSCNNSRRTETKLSDIHLGLGWNFWQDEDYHVGLGVLFVAPTGTRVDNTCLFKPQIGNGHHFELGGIFTAHYTLWRGCDWDQHFSFHVWAQVTHMFKTCQIRCFDLCNSDCNVNEMSRYMLAQQLGPLSAAGALSGTPTPLTPDQIGGDIPAGATFTASNLQFANRFVPLANLLNRQVEVSVPVQGDITALFNYTSCNFSWDFGYKFYGRSCEDFDCRPTFFTNTNIAANTSLALKGDAYVFGFPRVDGSLVTTGTPAVALAATQSTACITGGKNFAAGCTGTGTEAFAQLQRNPGIDNPQFAYTATNTTPLLAQPILAPGVPETDPNTQTRTSIQPILLSDQTAIDFNGQRTKDRTHTIFTHFSYQWDDYDCWVPYLGVGAKVEFARNNCDKNCGTLNSCSTNSCSTNSCSFNSGCSSFDDCNDNCKSCGLTQWGIWIKGGVSFN